MKVLSVFLVSLMLIIGGVCLANEHSGEPGLAVEEKKAPEVFCPATRFSDNDKCFRCHQMVIENGKQKFGLKELPPGSRYSDKPYCMDVIMENGELVAYMLVKGIDSDDFRSISQYLYRHPEFKKLIVEIYSPGGSVMSAWRIVGIIEEMRAHGITIETRCYGLAASAGGILLIAGDIGHRFVSPHAEIMLHKVWQFSMFDVSDPDSAEDKANILKHFQANINKFFQERTNLNAEKIDENTYHKMWWFTGAEAIQHGVADGLIGLR